MSTEALVVCYFIGSKEKAKGLVVALHSVYTWRPPERLIGRFFILENDTILAPSRLCRVEIPNKDGGVSRFKDRPRNVTKDSTAPPSGNRGHWKSQLNVQSRPCLDRQVCELTRIFTHFSTLWCPWAEDRRRFPELTALSSQRSCAPDELAPHTSHLSCCRRDWFGQELHHNISRPLRW